MIDYRTPDPMLRREYFKKYYYISMLTNDCDASLFLMDYVCNRLELNIEQRFWWSWLYANTYNLASAFVIFNEFPDFENTNIPRITKFNEECADRLQYENDNKWSKYHLPKMYEAYYNCLGGRLQQEYFVSLLSGNPTRDFSVLYDHVISKFYKFGRYTAWFYLQTLKEICDIETEPPSLLLEDASTHTQRAALAFILAWDDMANDKKHRYSPKQIQIMNIEAAKLLEEMKAEYIYQHCNYDYYNMETVLCAFKKTFRTKKGRYLGYYLDRQMHNINKAKDSGWSGIDWNLFIEGRKEMIHPDLITRNYETDEIAAIFPTRGVVPNMQAPVPARLMYNRW